MGWNINTWKQNKKNSSISIINYTNIIYTSFFLSLIFPIFNLPLELSATPFVCRSDALRMARKSCSLRSMSKGAENHARRFRSGRGRFSLVSVRPVPTARVSSLDGFAAWRVRSDRDPTGRSNDFAHTRSGVSRPNEPPLRLETRSSLCFDGIDADGAKRGRLNIVRSATVQASLVPRASAPRVASIAAGLSADRLTKAARGSVDLRRPTSRRTFRVTAGDTDEAWRANFGGAWLWNELGHGGNIRSHCGRLEG